MILNPLLSRCKCRAFGGISAALRLALCCPMLYALCPMLLVPVIQRRLPISGEWGVFEIRAAATEQLFFGSLND